MRIIPLLIGCIWVGVLTTACRHKLESFNDNNVAGGELRSPSQRLFAHINEEHYLTINGKTYRGVLGGAPSYLELPELHSVLFVTGSEDKSSVKFHMVNRETGHEVVINGGQIHFGTDIGSSRRPVEAFTDFVLKATSNEVTLASQAPKARLIIVSNLTSNVVESVHREEINAQ
jgi:hypothetical protein